MENLRKKIISAMNELNTKGINCSSCQDSECCTFIRNSMQITPLETFDLIYYLYREKRLNSELENTLKQNILEYRLDKELPNNGRRSFVRRSYTCPFFLQGIHACSIAPEYKPYGCLAFNSTIKDAVNSEYCNSDQGILKELEQDNLQTIKEINNKICQKFNLNFEKLPISNAILNILQNCSIQEVIEFYEKL